MVNSVKHVILVSALAGCTVISVSAQNSETTTSGQTSSSASGSQTTAPEKADHKTTSFLKEAAKDNQTEIALAEIAAQKAQNPELKAFAQKIQQDHQQAEQDLQPLAQKYGVSLEDANKARTSHEVTKFEKEEAGAKWDQKFATEALKSHYKDIERYQDATKLQAQDVKQFAESKLPTLRQHFEHAQTVASAVGVDQSTIASYAKKLPAPMGGSGDQQQQMQGTNSSTSGNTLWQHQNQHQSTGGTVH